MRPRDDATFDECQLVGLALTMRRPPFDFIQDGDDYVVFVDAPRSVRRTEKAIMHALAESEIVEAVITPLVVGHKAADGGYTYESWFDEPDPEPEPAVQAPEIAYCVSLSPPSVFGWRALREELQRQGRAVIAERGDAIEVGVRDKTDARALVDSLRDQSLIHQHVTITALGWLRRWKVRQSMLGNYALIARDPTRPV